MLLQINTFRDDYYFLSNFYPGDNTSLEHKYQAAKTLNTKEKLEIRAAKTPAAAKKLGKIVNIREDWDRIKIPTMSYLLMQKFSDPELQQLLLNTKDAELVEQNWWGDTFWGVCGTKGFNHLGRLLMATRYYYAGLN